MTPAQRSRCPAGHPSESSDYCDVCGVPMGAPAPSGTPRSGTPQQAAEADEPAAPAGVECPNCGVLNAPGALFCEACGYDYTTGTMPRPRPNPLDLDAPTPPAAEPEPPAEQEIPVQQEEPRAVLVEPKSTPAPARPVPPVPAQPVAPAAEQDAGPESQATPPRQPRDEATPAAAPAAAAAGPTDWVLEVWIDPEWYALQQSPDPMPSPGLPHVQPLRKRSVLIGRPSRSRGIAPDIDCEPDSGISRRHAQLSTDGSRWFLEDLDSANGTYVAQAADPLPTQPIPGNRRKELQADDRIYLGAWTRLVLRPATPEEQQLYAEG
ncbi:phosphopeptide-binding protein [Enemella evansiae]|uniref:FHA domain-containing protein n=1 Tax=Enemella evansiae TaxID=2016499 RepID=UPI000B96CD70|nr:FHA domain-containing protein [Enemella evansiae]OYO05102.1 phosphopeptide-binding protein [Enemella evansiae]